MMRITVNASNDEHYPNAYWVGKWIQLKTKRVLIWSFKDGTN